MRITLLSDAQNELIRLTQADSAPSILADIDSILAARLLASLWVASTAYDIGDVVQPNDPNGCRYVCVTAGTSTTTEPDWTTGRRDVVTDGTVLVWEEAGAEYLSLWDMRGAAYDGWMLKASKTLCNIDFSEQQNSYKNSQVYDHCILMANRNLPVSIA